MLLGQMTQSVVVPDILRNSAWQMHFRDVVGQAKTWAPMPKDGQTRVNPMFLGVSVTQILKVNRLSLLPLHLQLQYAAWQ